MIITLTRLLNVHSSELNIEKKEEKNEKHNVHFGGW